MNIYKTISGHYDTVYNIEHNNRTFIPKNVDIHRSISNYYCVAAGEEVWLDLNDPRHISEFWKRYKELIELYWENRATARRLAYRRYQEHLAYMRQFSRSLYQLSSTPIGAMITILLLPILIPIGIRQEFQCIKAQAEWEDFLDEQTFRDLQFKSTKTSLRAALWENDHQNGTDYLHRLDAIVNSMSIQADNHLSAPPQASNAPTLPPRFATLEEIYDRFYEPSFQDFQSKQRPCRRYNGTYLEQIREGQKAQAQKKQQNKNTRSHKTAEAIEIVFGIGDMDNTGYVAAPEDAQMSEALLRDFCNHLMEHPKVCCITTKELEDPQWEPPFTNGLIIHNLTLHADEATPGVHLTCIPYSRNCKRGPAVQASLSKALTGMGYPSTWKEKLDEQGQRIPKRDRNGTIIHNEDGTVRYQQEPDQQGILDWIEEQKQWLQEEMKSRYNWNREYKGAHPRGNLSTPDYQVARAKERQEEFQQLLDQSIESYDARVHELTLKLDDTVEKQWKNITNQDVINQYLRICSDEEYDSILSRASTYLDQLSLNEQQNLRKKLVDKIQAAESQIELCNTLHNVRLTEKHH